MRKTLFSLLIALTSVGAFGQEFWSHRVGIQTDVAYGDDPAQVADIYTQGHRPPVDPGFQLRPVDEPRPTLIWIHGGGWVRGDKASNFERAIHFLEQGWHVVNINYRIGAGTAPQAVDDVMCAYQWVVNEAQQSGRSNRFVVSGNSAGGHLALVVGLLNASGDHPCRADVVPSAVVNWYGITDIASLEAYLVDGRPGDNYALSWIGDKSRVQEISARYSPLALVTADAPPIITIHGTADKVVPHVQAEKLHAALSTRNRLVTLKGGTHGGFTDAQYQEATKAIFEFLAQ